MNKKVIVVLSILSVLLIQGGSQATIINPGFETGDFSGWTVGGVNGGRGVALDGTPISASNANFQPNFVNVRSGNFAGFAAIAETNGESLSLSQTVNLLPGLQTAGFFMGLDQNGGIGIDFAIDAQRLAILVNSVNQTFTTRFPFNNFPTGSTPAGFFEFSSNFTSVGGPTLLEFRISGSGTWRAGISVDDFFVTGAIAQAVPEPASIAIWSLASVVGFALRRRR